MEQLLYDEINNIIKIICKKKYLYPKDLNVEYTIIGNEHKGLSTYLLEVLNNLKLKEYNITINFVYDNIIKTIDSNMLSEKFSDYDINFYNDINDYKNNDHISPYINYIYISNAQRNEYDSLEYKSLKKSSLQSWLSYAEYCNELDMYSNVNFIMLSLLPTLDPLPNGIFAISEREYEVIVSNKNDNSGEKFILDLEDLCRKYVRGGLNLKCLRYDYIFGPGFNDMGNPKIDDILNKFIYENKCEISYNDSLIGYSASYIRYAIAQIFLILKKGESGNIYNATSYRFTLFDLTSTIFKAFLEQKPSFSIKARNNNEVSNKQYCYLSNKKISKFNLKVGCSLKNVLYRTILSRIHGEYINAFYNTVYNGKLPKIRELELNIMDEIDSICKRNNIKYFLVGGSLLGAIRHKGFIPWDDDLDIGMLRDDYEKFRKICPQLLNSKFAYQSYTDEPNSHYIFDKVRLKNTYFTTKFSEQFKIENGIFIDILVYDKTSSSKLGQKIHIKLISILKRIINIRWVDTPRKNIHYHKSKLMLPIMRLIPFKYYHHLFEKVITFYNKGNSNYLIDSVGMNLKKGAFPIEWFDETIDVKFENRKFPIPSKYDEYLKHWYGDSYMELLPISTRNSGHNIIRLDLGKYLLNNSDDICNNLHELDPRGELFEYTRNELNEMSEKERNDYYTTLKSL